jgi:hypothetical protein
MIDNDYGKRLKEIRSIVGAVRMAADAEPWYLQRFDTAIRDLDSIIAGMEAPTAFKSQREMRDHIQDLNEQPDEQSAFEAADKELCRVYRSAENRREALRAALAVYTAAIRSIIQDDPKPPVTVEDAAEPGVAFTPDWMHGYEVGVKAGKLCQNERESVPPDELRRFIHGDIPIEVSPQLTRGIAESLTDALLERFEIRRRSSDA